MPGGAPTLTFGIIKPDAFDRRDAILRDIVDEEFEIVWVLQRTLTRAQVEEFYAEHAGKPFFDGLVSHMTSGPSLGMVLRQDVHSDADSDAQPDAIRMFRESLGDTNPTKAEAYTLRGRYGSTMTRNALHGSDTPEAVVRETALWTSFPTA